MALKQRVRDIASRHDVNNIYAQKIYRIAIQKDSFEEVENLIKDKPKPFIKWVGGKRQLLKQFRLLNLYPPEDFNPDEHAYFEPFVGGGAVFFDLLPEKAELSDLNAELVTTYNVIKNDVEALIKSLSQHKYEKEYYLNVRSWDPQSLSDIEVASRFIYLNRTGFNGMYRVNSKGKFNVPFGRYSNPSICDEENLRRVSDALQGVVINCQDYKKVLDKARKSDFIYFDPPYYPLNRTSSFTSYTAESFLEDEQTELRNAFLELHKRGCFVMLSNSDTNFINDLYSNMEGVKVNRVQAGRSINSKGSKRGKISEVLVTNY